MHKRIIREKHSIETMMAIYCRAKHGTTDELCEDCTKLKDYALQRLNHCHFGVHKPACAKCPIHCYRPENREKIKAVMRYAGPRMVYRHPLLAFYHLIDSLKSPR